jgi:hypothetical protein
MENINVKKLLVYGLIGVGGILALTFIARRVGNKPQGIWIYR